MMMYVSRKEGIIGQEDVMVIIYHEVSVIVRFQFFNYGFKYTPTIEGSPIREYKGIVTGETIIGANVFKDFMAGLRDFFGGRSGTYEKVLAEAKDTSLSEMAERARQMGANAVVGIDLDYETIGQGNSMLMVTCSGTAVVI